MSDATHLKARSAAGGDLRHYLDVAVGVAKRTPQGFDLLAPSGEFCGVLNKEEPNNWYYRAPGESADDMIKIYLDGDKVAEFLHEVQINDG